MAETKDFRILSLDGGGIRGAIEAQVLKCFEEDLGKPLHSFFDFIAGTSTGGIITCLLGGKQLMASDCVDLYNHENASTIMNKSIWDRMLPMENQPKYDGKGKREVLDAYLGERRIRDPEVNKILITAYDVITRKIVTFKSYGGSDSAYNPTLAEVADATSAAPSFFPTIKTTDQPARWLIDGGVAANHPGMCALTEALKMGIPIESVKMLSIGTGIASWSEEADTIGKESRDWGAIGWIKHGLIDHLFSGNSSAVENYCKQALGSNCVRVNGPLTYASSEMDDVSEGNIDNLLRTGKEWYLEHRDDILELFGLPND